MKPKAIYINAYGLVSIYVLMSNFDEVIEKLRNNSTMQLEDFITMISNMTEIGEIKLIEDSEIELPSKDYYDVYNIVFERKFI